MGTNLTEIKGKIRINIVREIAIYKGIEKRREPVAVRGI